MEVVLKRRETKAVFQALHRIVKCEGMVPPSHELRAAIKVIRSGDIELTNV